EHSVLVRCGSNVRTWSARAAGHEPDPLEPVFEPGSRECGRAEQALGQHACSVVRQDGDGVGPHRRVLPVALHEPTMKTLDKWIVRIELIDSHPPLELLEAHQIEHEGG